MLFNLVLNCCVECYTETLTGGSELRGGVWHVLPNRDMRLWRCTCRRATRFLVVLRVPSISCICLGSYVAFPQLFLQIYSSCGAFNSFGSDRCFPPPPSANIYTFHSTHTYGYYCGRISTELVPQLSYQISAKRLDKIIGRWGQSRIQIHRTRLIPLIVRTKSSRNNGGGGA